MTLAAGCARAQQTHAPYGLAVGEAELRFMTGVHSLAVDRAPGRGAASDYAGAANAHRKAAVLGFPLARTLAACLPAPLE